MTKHGFARLAFGVALGIVAAACSDDKISGPADAPRVFNQVERLGNPLVSEVFLEKRDHGFHNAGKPSTDVANFKAKLEGFVRNVAGRNQTVQTTLSTVLLPDMLIVQLDKAPTSAGWLTWALANGYGGRRLNDDVVDAGLAALFGGLLDPSNQSPGLTSQHVPGNDKPFLSTFPYLAEASR
jgi:Domain of unknown function (DUF4331)